MKDGSEIETYLGELRRHLGPMTLEERDEVVREIQAHIRDAAEQGTTVAAVMERLGPAAELAALYREGLLLRQTSRSFSPLTLLRGAARMATKGAAGTVVFLAALLGYTLGAGMVIGALLKPFFPDKVGIFASDAYSSSVTSGLQTMTTTTRTTPHEMLGIWAIPIFLTVGSLTLLATTMLVRAVLRESQRWQTRLQ